MKQRCLCLLLVEYVTKVREDKSFARSEQMVGMAAAPLELQKTFEKMMDFGSRYRNLDKALKKGVVIFLGTTMPESRQVLYPHE
jgi:hypothetical protein